MKINEREIAESARRLRETENDKLRIKPWRRRRLAIPSWAAFIPAAALLGFFFGVQFGEKRQTEDVLAMAKTDTVYIKEIERVTERDTIYRNIPAVSRSETAPVEVLTGVPMSDDGIRYELLVME